MKLGTSNFDAQIAAWQTLMEAIVQGDTIYGSAAETLARLAKGSANFKKFMNEAGTLPEWAQGVKTGVETHTISGANMNVTVNVGFRPSIIITIGALVGAGAPFLVSIWSISGGIKSIYYRDYDGYVSLSVSEVGYLYDFSGAYGIYYLTSITATGWTYTSTKTGSPVGTTSLGYLAIR